MIFFTRLQTDFGFFSLLSSCCLFPGAEEPAGEEAALTDLRTPRSFVSQGKKKLEGRTSPKNQSNKAQMFKKGGGPHLGRQAALPTGSGCLPSAQGSSEEAFAELSPVPLLKIKISPLKLKTNFLNATLPPRRAGKRKYLLK